MPEIEETVLDLAIDRIALGPPLVGVKLLKPERRYLTRPVHIQFTLFPIRFRSSLQ